VSLVIDASVALAWLFDRLEAREAAQAMKLLASLRSRRGLVPALWHTEIVNVLAVAQRRGVLSISKASDFLAGLDRLSITTDDSPVAPRKGQLLSLAREQSLSAYDATYLELALRTGSALATFDQKLAKARDASGIAAE
jgi:predicted nucleic acid-binding protein